MSPTRAGPHGEPAAAARPPQELTRPPLTPPRDRLSLWLLPRPGRRCPQQRSTGRGRVEPPPDQGSAPWQAPTGTGTPPTHPAPGRQPALASAAASAEPAAAACPPHRRRPAWDGQSSFSRTPPPPSPLSSLKPHKLFALTRSGGRHSTPEVVLLLENPFPVPRGPRDLSGAIGNRRGQILHSAERPRSGPGYSSQNTDRDQSQSLLPR